MEDNHVLEIEFQRIFQKEHLHGENEHVHDPQYKDKRKEKTAAAAGMKLDCLQKV